MAKKLWDNEKELAATIVDYLKADGWQVYPEIWDIDIVAKRPDPNYLNGVRIIGIETKLHFNLKVLSQAYHKKPYVDQMYVGVSDGRDDDEGFGVEVARKFGLGVIYSKKYLYPKCYIPVLNKYQDGTCQYKVRKSIEAEYVQRISDIENLLDPEAQNFAEAGQAGGKSWSLFQRTALRLKEYVTANPGKTLKEVVAAIPHHYSSAASARSALKKLIGSVIEGIEVKENRLYPTSPIQSPASE